MQVDKMTASVDTQVISSPGPSADMSMTANTAANNADPSPHIISENAEPDSVPTASAIQGDMIHYTTAAVDNHPLSHEETNDVPQLPPQTEEPVLWSFLNIDAENENDDRKSQETGTQINARQESAGPATTSNKGAAATCDTTDSEKHTDVAGHDNDDATTTPPVPPYFPISSTQPNSSYVDEIDNDTGAKNGPTQAEPNFPADHAEQGTSVVATEPAAVMSDTPQHHGSNQLDAAADIQINDDSMPEYHATLHINPENHSVGDANAGVASAEPTDYEMNGAKDIVIHPATILNASAQSSGPDDSIAAVRNEIIDEPQPAPVVPEPTEAIAVPVGDVSADDNSTHEQPKDGEIDACPTDTALNSTAHPERVVSASVEPVSSETIGDEANDVSHTDPESTINANFEPLPAEPTNLDAVDGNTLPTIPDSDQAESSSAGTAAVEDAEPVSTVRSNGINLNIPPPRDESGPEIATIADAEPTFVELRDSDVINSAAIASMADPGYESVGISQEPGTSLTDSAFVGEVIPNAQPVSQATNPFAFSTELPPPPSIDFNPSQDQNAVPAIPSLPKGYDDIVPDESEVRANTPDIFMEYSSPDQTQPLQTRYDHSEQTPSEDGESEYSYGPRTPKKGLRPNRIYVHENIYDNDKSGTYEYSSCSPESVHRVYKSSRYVLSEDVDADEEPLMSGVLTTPTNDSVDATDSPAPTQSLPYRQEDVFVSDKLSAKVRDESEDEPKKGKKRAKAPDLPKNAQPKKRQKRIVKEVEKEQSVIEMLQKLATPLTTKLSHPVIFNHYDPNGVENCHMCSTRYAMLGLGTRNIKIYESADGKGLKELLDKGATQPEQTRLCMMCTMTRMRQMICRVHTIRAIENNNKILRMDFLAAFKRAMEEKPDKHDQWCSICPTPALYKCCGSKTDAANTVPAQSSGSGCGLLFCEPCAVRLHDDFKGELAAFLKETSDEVTAERPMGLRADVELLRSGGPLEKFIMWMAGAR